MSRSALRHRRIPVSSVSPPAGGNSYDALVLADNPEGYWTLDGTSAGLQDRTGHGHNATNFGATLATFVNGDGAFAFDGINDYVQVPNSTKLSVTGTGVMTLEVWMSPAVTTFPNAESKNGLDDYIHWMGKQGSSNNEYAAVMYQFAPLGETDRSNRISGYAYALVGGEGPGSYFQDVITVNEWIHYTLVINTIDRSTYSMGYVRIYKNGVLRDTDTLAGSYNVVPAHGTAPLRFGTTTFESYLQGRLAKAAFYGYELSQAQIRAHYLKATSGGGGGGGTATGSLLRHVGKAETATSGTRLQIVVGNPGVAVGSTLLARFGSRYVATGPTMADSRGNTWVLDKTGVDDALTLRNCLFSCRVQVALKVGDIIEARTSVAVAGRDLAVDEFDHLQFVPVNVVNGTDGISTTPSVTATPGVADTIVHASVAVLGPTADAFTADTAHSMLALTRAGTNTGSNDVTVNAAYKAAGSVADQTFSPVLGTSRTWVDLIAAYAAGTPVVSPPAQGTATFVKTLTSASASTAGTTLTLTVPSPDTIPVGSTLFVTIGGDYTAGHHTVTSAGNTWTRDRSAPDTGTTIRGGMFSCPVSTAIAPGGTITVTWSTSVTRRQASLLWFGGIAVPTVVDAQTGVDATSGNPASTLTTVTANTLLLAAVVMAGPANSAYTPDVAWVSTPTVGTTGAGTADRTLYTSYRIAAGAGGYVYNPELQGSYTFVELLVAYRATTTTPPPPPSGDGDFVRTLDEETATTSGTTLTLTVPSGGVATGNTPVLAINGDYTANLPAATDSRGNTWTLLRSGQNGTIRTTLLYCQMTTRLQAADAITVTWPVAITRREAVASEYTGVLIPVTVDVVNSKGGTSTGPNVTILTANADDLIISAVGFAAPSTTTYTEHTAGLWTKTSHIGTTGGAAGADRSLATAYRSVDTAGSYTHAPTLGTSVGWISVIGALRAGDSEDPPPPPPPASTYEALIIADEPQAYWTLDGTDAGLLDKTGNGHHATNFGAVAGSFLGGGGSFSFDGVNDYLEVADHPALSIPPIGVLALEMWINTTTLNFTVGQGSSNYVHLAGKGRHTKDEYLFRIYPAENSLAGIIFGYIFDQTPPAGETTNYGTGARTLPTVPGQWVHIMFVTDTTKTTAEYEDTDFPGFVRMYMNGVVTDLDPLSNYSVAPTRSTDPLRFGAVSAHTESDTSYYPGRIAQAAIYRHDLTPQKVMAHYRKLVPLVVGTGGQVRSLGTTSSGSSGTTSTLTVPSGGVATGNTPFVSTYTSYVSAPVVTDSRGNTWTLDRGMGTSDNTGRLSVFRCTMNTRLQAGDTITATWSTAPAKRAMVGSEVTGLATPAVIDSVVSVGASTFNPRKLTAWPLTRITPANTNTIIVGAIGIDGAVGTIIGPDDPEAWKWAGAAGSTGGATGVDRSVMMGVRSVTSIDMYTFGVHLTEPARWGSASCVYRIA